MAFSNENEKFSVRTVMLLLKPIVNPRILREKLVQLSGWANDLKIQTFGRNGPQNYTNFSHRILGFTL